MTKKQLEAKYGVKIVKVNEWYGVYEYKIYSADGCPWENGLRTLKAVENECKEWAKALIEIKANVEKQRHTA